MRRFNLLGRLPGQEKFEDILPPAGVADAGRWMKNEFAKIRAEGGRGYSEVRISLAEKASCFDLADFVRNAEAEAKAEAENNVSKPASRRRGFGVG
jgi:hypothetical protein